MTIAILILNYNGKHLVENCVKSIKKTTDYQKLRPDIMVLDNASEDDDVEYLQKKFKNLKIIAFKKNHGMSAYNKAVKKIKHEYTMFLNNDVLVENGFLEKLLPLLRTTDSRH